jgi:hypothetical protein
VCRSEALGDREAWEVWMGARQRSWRWAEWAGQMCSRAHTSSCSGELPSPFSCVFAERRGRRFVLLLWDLLSQGSTATMAPWASSTTSTYLPTPSTCRVRNCTGGNPPASESVDRAWLDLPPKDEMHHPPAICDAAPWQCLSLLAHVGETTRGSNYKNEWAD